MRWPHGLVPKAGSSVHATDCRLITLTTPEGYQSGNERSAHLSKKHNATLLFIICQHLASANAVPVTSVVMSWKLKMMVSYQRNIFSRLLTQKLFWRVYLVSPGECFWQFPDVPRMTVLMTVDSFLVQSSAAKLLACDNETLTCAEFLSKSGEVSFFFPPIYPI